MQQLTRTAGTYHRQHTGRRIGRGQRRRSGACTLQRRYRGTPRGRIQLHGRIGLPDGWRRRALRWDGPHRN